MHGGTLMNEILRNDILNLLAIELKPKFLDDFNQLLNLKYRACIDSIRDIFYTHNHDHAAQRMFANAQLYLAEAALHQVAEKHKLKPVLLSNEHLSDKYIILSSKSFNLLLVRGQAANKHRGKYKSLWASMNKILEDKQLRLDYDDEMYSKALDSTDIDDKITIVIEAFYTMSEIKENPSSIINPHAFFKFSIPNSRNTGFLTSLSYKELMSISQSSEEFLSNNEAVTKHSLINIKKRLSKATDEAVNE